MSAFQITSDLFLKQNECEDLGWVIFKKKGEGRKKDANQHYFARLEQAKEFIAGKYGWKFYAAKKLDSFLNRLARFNFKATGRVEEKS